MTMMAGCVELLTVLGAFAVLSAYGQIHLGPQGTASPTAQCYHCDDHHDQFPECTNHAQTCHHDEVCSITYGNGRPTTRCQKKEDCRRETEHYTRVCSEGGVEIHPNECKKCCETPDCTNGLVDLLKLEFAQSPDLYCPGHCDANDIASCLSNGHRCHDWQFCEISKDDHGKVKGECKEDHDYHHCTEELKHHPCDHDVGHHGPHHGRCFWDCCDTTACLQTHFGAYMTTMAPPTTATNATAAPTTTAATTMAPVMTTSGDSLWERLHGNCADALQGDQCALLAQTQDVCHDRLALSVCPKTCGLCDAINNTACKDTVVDDGCSDLAANEDVCSTALSVFICPRTCNKCDELVNSVITSLVEGNSSATSVPATDLPPSANPSDFPTFDCNDLKGESCDMVNSVCGSSFANVVCPQECAVCAAAMMTTPQSTPAPTTTLPPTTTTTAATVPTSTPVMVPVTGNATCMDHVNSISCSELADVCNSVMAMPVCPKFCGLC